MFRIEQSGRMSSRRPKPQIKGGSAPEDEEEEEKKPTRCTISELYFVITTLHASDTLTVHHQESWYCIHGNWCLSYWLCWLSASEREKCRVVYQNKVDKYYTLLASTVRVNFTVFKTMWRRERLQAKSWIYYKNWKIWRLIYSCARHVDVWGGSVSITPPILDLGTAWKWAFSIQHRLLSCRKRQ